MNFNQSIIQSLFAQTSRTKTPKIKKADITFAAHCHNVNVLLSNISLFDFWCFSSASS